MKKKPENKAGDDKVTLRFKRPQLTDKAYHRLIEGLTPEQLNLLIPIMHELRIRDKK